MRKIKFRKWSKNTQGEFRMKMVEDLNEIKDPNLKVMMFTGLLDKHGKEIYGGDILKWGTGKEAVVFENGAFGFIGASFDHLMEETGEDFYSILEIIGNVYEDSKLLK